MLFEIENLKFNLNERNGSYEIDVHGYAHSAERAFAEWKPFLQELDIHPLSAEDRNLRAVSNTVYSISADQAIGLVILAQNSSKQPQSAEQLNAVKNFIVSIEDYAETFLRHNEKLRTRLEQFKSQLTQNPAAESISQYNQQVLRLLESHRDTIAGKSSSRPSAKTTQFDNSRKFQRLESINALIDRAREEMTAGRIINAHQLAKTLESESPDHEAGLTKSAPTGLRKLVGGKSEFSKTMDAINQIPKPVTEPRLSAASAAAPRK